MLIDEQTFRDLEVFEAQGGAPSLFDLLDRTRTRGGRDKLRARFRRPLSRADEIRAVQDSLRFIAAHRGGFDLLPEEAALSALQRYIHSNLVLVSALSGFQAYFESAELWLTGKKLYQKTVAGLRRTAATLRALSAFASRSELSAAPGELAGLVAEMRELLAHPALSALVSEGEQSFTWWRVLRLDRQLRHDDRPALERLMRIVHEVDALVAMADAQRERGYILPEVHDGPTEAVGEGVYHPFLEDPVPNPLHADASRRFLFLTGPNMAGKTTYLRACGTAVYLAHLGMGVPARSFRFAPCDMLFSAITLADNVREGVSFFRAEALRVKRIAQTLADGHRVFALLDEPFKGTNLKDALDASRAVFTRLAGAEGSVFLVSSHLIELAESLREIPSVACHRFDAREEGGTLQYDFVLRPGVSTQRLGVRVLEEEGVFELLERVGGAGSGRADAARVG